MAAKTGTYTLIASNTLATAATSVNFTSIPSTYTDLIVVSSLGKASTGAAVQFTLNSDGGTNYSTTEMYGNGTSPLSSRTSTQSQGFICYSVVPGAAITSNFIFNILDYANTTTYKTTLSRSGSLETTYSGTATNISLWRSTAAVSSISFGVSGNVAFTIGSTFKLYGIEAAK